MSEPVMHSARIPSDLRNALRAEAALLGMSAQRATEQAIEEWVQQARMARQGAGGAA